MADLESRGLSDVFVACVGGLSGSPEAIRAAYSLAKVRLCVVHLVRAALLNGQRGEADLAGDQRGVEEVGQADHRLEAGPRRSTTDVPVTYSSPLTQHFQQAPGPVGAKTENH